MDPQHGSENVGRRERTVLCLNAGSSSLKYALYRTDGGNSERVAGGDVEEIGSRQVADHREAVRIALDALAGDGDWGDGPDAAGHRIVHGGTTFASPVLIDDNVLEQLRELTPLAPDHQPGAIAGIEALRELDPALVQVACFDTGFHADLPERAKRFPLPDSFWEAGVRRFGFHGLSFEYVLGQLGPSVPAKTIIAHLGNGSSLVALKEGRPVETTMGFTPNSGLVMGSRSGDIEPGVLLYLMRDKGYTADELDRLLNGGAGMRGISGETSDVRKLLEGEGGDGRFARALDLFIYSVQKHLGGLVAVLGGLDLLVFTGGIGENREVIRERILDPLREFLDFEVRVVATDEEAILAQKTVAILS